MTDQVSALPRSIEYPDGTIVLPDAPPIPALVFRHWRGEADLLGLVNVANATRRADGNPDVATVESMGHDYANLTNCDLATDLLVAEADGAIAAYARVSWEDQNDGDRAYICFGFVHPDWRRRGLGRAMLRHDERRLREIASGQTFDGTSYLASFAEDHNVGNEALLTSESYRRHRAFFLMVRPDLEHIPEVSLPEGLEIRPVEPDHLRPLFLAENEAFRDHFGGIDASEAAFRRWTGSATFEPALFIVAWAGNEIAAAVVNTIDPAENELYGYRRGLLQTVFTRRPWRQRGVARALISRSLVLHRDRGMTSAQLGVDAENPNSALHLYESSGFRVERSSSAWRKDWDVSRGGGGDRLRAARPGEAAMTASCRAPAAREKH
jgi:ribosomal protein S18 acetylase RimI-like enzyme